MTKAARVKAKGEVLQGVAVDFDAGRVSLVELEKAARDYAREVRSPPASRRQDRVVPALTAEVK
jgi:hypothetical protein